MLKYAQNCENFYITVRNTDKEHVSVIFSSYNYVLIVFVEKDDRESLEGN